MGKETGIPWCDHTFNLVWGCVECSPECDNCYARVLAKRYGFGWGINAPRRTFGAKYWAQPRLWDRRAASVAADLAAMGRVSETPRPRVFCSSMADVFEDHPTVAEERSKLWGLIQDTPHLDWLLLTKRPGNFLRAMDTDCHAESGCPVFCSDDRLPRNVWAGTTVGHRKSLWRLRALKDLPAKVRFLSVEPLLEDLGPLDLYGIDWVIVGGESGPHARPFDLAWARSIRDQCQAAGVAFFMKQLGPHPHTVFYDHQFDPPRPVGRMESKLKDSHGGDESEWPEDLRVREFPRSEVVA